MPQAVMKSNNIGAILSVDEDFEGVEEVDRLDPLEFGGGKDG